MNSNGVCISLSKELQDLEMGRLSNTVNRS